MKKEQACTEMKMEQFESGDREYWVENSVRVHYSPCLLYTRIKKNIKNVMITMADQTPSCGNEKRDTLYHRARKTGRCSVWDLYKKQRNKTNYFAKNCKINPFFQT